jgi:ankyrin repeat protein
MELVRTLVKEMGADVNKSSHEGTSPLIVAAMWGNLDVVRALVKQLGADISRPTNEVARLSLSQLRRGTWLLFVA